MLKASIMIKANELARLALSGDKKAEKELFDYFLDRFTCLAKLRTGGNDAEDIAQEACLTIVEKLRQNGGVPENFNAWAYDILRKKIGNYYQYSEVRNRYVIRESDSRGAINQGNHPPDPNLIRSLEECMKEIIRTNLVYARVVNLAFQGYDTDYISRRLNTCASNVYNILSRGRRLLKHCLKGKVNH